MDSPSIAKPCILIVDDDEFYRRIIGKYLDQEGYEWSEASSGEKTLDMYHPGQYDVVLLDLMMDNITGVDTLRSLREQHPEDDTPIIVISARDDKTALFNSIAAGAIEYLTKPIDSTELIVRLRTLVRLRMLQKEVLQRERLLSQQKLLDNLTATIAHHINNAATSILLLCEAEDLDSAERYEHFRSVVQQQTQRIVQVVSALQKVKSLKDKTIQYVGDIEMIDIRAELQEMISLLDDNK